MEKTREVYWNYDYNYEIMCAELKRFAIIFPKFNEDSAIEKIREFMGEELNYSEPDPRVLIGYFKQIEYWEKCKKERLFRKTDI